MTEYGIPKDPTSKENEALYEAMGIIFNRCISAAHNELGVINWADVDPTKDYVEEFNKMPNEIRSRILDAAAEHFFNHMQTLENRLIAAIRLNDTLT